MDHMMNLNVSKDIVSILRLVGALEAPPNTLPILTSHLRTLRVQH